MNMLRSLDRASYKFEHAEGLTSECLSPLSGGMGVYLVTYLVTLLKIHVF